MSGFCIAMLFFGLSVSMSMAETSTTPAPKDTLAVIETNHGKIVFKFYRDAAPQTVENFINLANAHFYDGLIFHRIIKNFVIQGGCPEGTGRGNPGYFIKAEFNQHKHVPGAVAMARSQDPNSAGSQFYLCLNNLPSLDNNYTVFGQVVEGMDVVNEIGSVPTVPGDRPAENVFMNKVYIIER
jgi:cyclophilin family peptidyl-prolyl cis-trans isomerase